MSENTRLPKGASKWWNLPAEQLTKEQRDIKRKYARDLYHKKKKITVDPTALKRENAFLKSIIENYRINLRSLFDNDNMNEQQAVPSTATFLEYKKAALKKPFEILARDQDLPSEALLALAAADDIPVIKFQKHCIVCSCESESFHSSSISVLNSTENQVELRVPRYFDILYGLYAQGDILKVELLHNGNDSDFTTVEYGEVTDNYCHFPIPVPSPTLVELRIRVTFSNDLHIEKWPYRPGSGGADAPSRLLDRGPKTTLVVSGGMFNSQIRKKLGYGITNLQKWPEGTPTDCKKG